MSGKRMIHESLFSSEALCELPIEARYLFIATIVHADDYGRMRADAKYLKIKAFPFDDHRAEDVLKWRDQLATNPSLFVVYAVDGKDYLYHPNWEKWQILRKDRMKSSDFPLPCPQGGNQAAASMPQSAAEVKEVKVRKLREEKIREVKEVKQSPSFASLGSTPHVKNCTCEACWANRPFPERV